MIIVSQTVRCGVLIVTSIIASMVCRTAVSDELTCLTEEEKTAAVLYDRLKLQAHTALDRRAAAFEELTTVERIREYQAKQREFFIRQLGGFPERSPLNAQTVRTIDADGYRIECVVFESRPDHHITANLYLPKADGAVPGVAVSSGHSRTAKTADYNQRFGIMMARHGMAALCFDPIGQGERSQILNGDGQPQFSGTTTEHFLVGVGSILVGRNTAAYRVWDAMRAIDYLSSRPEIDPQRIGFTGCSGGGTLTSYVMALDDRVACAAPACYLTTFRHLIDSIGPQDAEQNIFGQIAFGMDHPDYLLMRAPRPTLISSTTGDYFSIVGAWENYRQAKRIYGRLGVPERVDLVEVEGRHGVHPQNLATIAYWMQRWLLDRDAAVATAELSVRAPEELLCTSTGQVLTAFPGEKSVIDLNADFETQLANQRRGLQQSLSADELRTRIAELLQMSVTSDDAAPEFTDMGRISRDGYHIDKLVLRTNSGAVLPGLTFHPPEPADDAYVYLHDAGKSAADGANEAVTRLMEEGYAVVAVDLSGQGETASEVRDAALTDWKTYFLSYLLGRSLTSIRTEDILAVGHFVGHYQKGGAAPRKVHLYAEGLTGVAALHAAAVQPDRFASVTLRNTPRDWASVVRMKAPVGQLDAAVHGALQFYDLPDLVRLIGPAKVKFIEP
ncbi:MAG: acetylxylan esterase [Planctomycetaceae bacterium]|nr:acetylxylan esterase [Planctomycetaceae bacterium]